MLPSSVQRFYIWKMRVDLEAMHGVYKEVYFDCQTNIISNPLSYSSVEWIALGNNQFPTFEGIGLEIKEAYIQEDW